MVFVVFCRWYVNPMLFFVDLMSFFVNLMSLTCVEHEIDKLSIFCRLMSVFGRLHVDFTCFFLIYFFLWGGKFSVSWRMSTWCGLSERFIDSQWSRKDINFQVITSDKIRLEWHNKFAQTKLDNTSSTIISGWVPACSRL